MRLGTFVVLTVSLFLPNLFGAETPVRPRNFPPPVISPEVHSDRTVTFRVRAPNAKEVKVSGEWPGGAKDLANDGAGLWSVTLGPLEPELYGYSFSIDGFQTLDPGNSSVKPMRSPRTSILDIPGDKPHDFRPAIAHGAVRVHAYESKALNKRRGLYVYTPPDYDKQPSSRYPVLYLFHGAGDNEATWIVLGRAHWILDNLLADGKVKPMIVVMTDGHAAPPSPPGGGAGGFSRNIEVFEQDLLKDVIPFVEANYRIQPNAENRAIIGLSMGGGQSLTIGLTHPELFAWVGGMSSAVFNPEATLANALKDPQKTNERLKLLWFGCGQDDFLIKNNQQFSELLEKAGIKHTFRQSPGNHSWPVWRRYLAEFAPLPFKDSATAAKE